MPMTLPDHDDELGPAPVHCSGCRLIASRDPAWGAHCICAHASCDECGVPYPTAEDRADATGCACRDGAPPADPSVVYSGAVRGTIYGAGNSAVAPVATSGSDSATNGGASFEPCDAFCKGCVHCLADF